MLLGFSPGREIVRQGLVSLQGGKSRAANSISMDAFAPQTV